MRSLILLGLVACGGGGATGTVSWEPTLFSSGGSGQSGAWGFGECSLRCEQVKQQLSETPGTPGPINCWTTDLFGAGSLSACDCAFERHWGVSLSVQAPYCPD
jgi:hypothetical protein